MYRSHIYPRETSHKPFSKHQNDTTLDQYELPMYRVLLLLVRTIDGSKPYKIPLNKDEPFERQLERSIIRLKNSIGCKHPDPNDVLEHVRKALTPLIAGSWEETESNPVPNPCMRMVIIQQLTPDGRWHDAIHITPILTKMRYIVVSTKRFASIFYSSLS